MRVTQSAAENARQGTEIERLRQENEALRASAEIWIRMYENQLARANRAHELLSPTLSVLTGDRKWRSAR